ncbi:MAG: mannose-6-phosphate isomerase [Bacteroidales bacterium]|nr:mannose-6-phosphate isomerase [Bacteroidales bacterium]
MWKFEPILKTTIWGGDRIAVFKKISNTDTNIGESWELSGVEGSESIVSAGPDTGLTLTGLIDKYKSQLLGERNYTRFGHRFPLLIKFIDAREDLSVQVHPDDEMAARLGHSCGKSEMWYVLQAPEGARLANGFKTPVDPKDYDRLIETGEIEQVLNFNAISPGDVYFIPAGRVHAIGKGAFVAEIQQTSDDTFRLYDYHRKGPDGKERELHTELAREAIDFNDCSGKATSYTVHENIPVNVVTSTFFTTNVLALDHEMMRDYSEADTFVAIVATGGSAELVCGTQTTTIRQGETVLVSADSNSLILRPLEKFTALETYIK